MSKSKPNNRLPVLRVPEKHKSLDFLLKSSNLNIYSPFKGTYLEEILELGGKILDDQAEWLDQSLKKMLQPEDYKLVVGDKIGDEQKNRIIAGKYKLKVEHIANTIGMRIWHNDPTGRGMTILGQFKPVLQVEDGQKIYFVEPTPDDPDPTGDAIWPGKN